MVKRMKTMTSDKIMKWLSLSLLPLLFLLNIPHANASELTSIVDRTEISIDETLELKVRYSGNRAQGRPEFSELETQFDILSTSQSNQFSSVNGQVTAYTDWQLILAPKKEGTLLIPSFKYENAISDAVEIKVLPAANAPAGQLNDIFVETEIDKTEAYVQEQIKVTYRLFYSVNVDSLEDQPLELTNVIKERLPDARYSKRIQGKLYRVAEFNYALFPQTSDNIEIPSLNWNVRVPKGNSRQSLFGLSGRFELKRLRTDAKTVTVKQRPASFPAGSAWLPAESFNIQERWSQPTENFNLGEPITRTITMRATGLMAEQLPYIWGSLQADGYTSYADQPDLNNNFTAEGATSTRVESAAVVITQPGEWQLPAIRIPWWNTRTDTLEYAEIPATLISSGDAVAPEKNEASAPSAAQENVASIDTETLTQLENSVGFWKTTSAILFLISILSLSVSGWLWSRRGHFINESSTQITDTNKRERSAFKSLERACLNQNADGIRKSLLEWAQLFFGKDVKTLDAISQHGNSDLAQALQSLDASLYGTNPPSVDGGALASLLNQLRSSEKQKHSQSDLAPLYPTR